MKLVSVFLAIVLMVSLASIALARGAPNENVFTDQAIVSVDVAPTVANVPVMTGFDVILNISSPAFSRLANVNKTSDTSVERRQSTTVAERNSKSAATSYSARSGPNNAMVLLA